MKVYIAGPMRGIPGFNFDAFFEAQQLLENLGHEVFNPAARDTEKHPEIDWQDSSGSEDEIAAVGFNIREALHADTEFITLHADAVVLLPGWSGSRGATAERALALALGLKVMDIGEFETARAHFGNIGNEAPEYRAVQQIVPDQSAEFDRRHPEPYLPPLAPGWQDVIRAEDGTEVRSVSSTGAMKGTKLARFDLLPVHALTEVAKHYGRTAHKYPPNNWRKGYEWSKSYAALLRHVTQWWNGEDLDEELDTPHLAAVAWHALTLLEYAKDHPEMDDRP